MLHPRFDHLCLLIPDRASSVSLIERLSTVEISASVYSDTKYGIQVGGPFTSSSETCIFSFAGAY